MGVRTLLRIESFKNIYSKELNFADTRRVIVLLLVKDLQVSPTQYEQFNVEVKQQ